MSKAIASLLQKYKDEAALRNAHVTVDGSTQAIQTVEVPEALKSLPPHILASTPMDKLVLQSPYFECPAWAAPPPPNSTAHFDVRKGAERLSPFLINKFPYYLVGLSHKVCDFFFEHPSVSRVHCAVIHHKSGVVFVLDVGSANGVRVNGTRIAQAQPVALKEGDQVQIGASTRVLTLSFGVPPPKVSSSSSAAAAATQPPTAVVPAATAASGAVGTKRTLPEAETATSQAPRQQPPAEPPAVTVLSTSSAAAGTTAASAAAVAPTPAVAGAVAATVEVAHVLLKHKDVDNPVSRAPRNRNAPVTRSKEDALKMAKLLRDKHFAVQPVSLAAFTTVVEQFSECATAKNGGKMPVIKRGEFMETIEDAAFALKHMHVSEPVETQLGVHLFLRLSPEE